MSANRLAAPAALAAAILLGAAVVLGGPLLADALVGAVAGDAALSPPVGQTAFTLLLFGALLLIGLIGGGLCGRNAAALGPRPFRRAAAGAAIGLFGIAAATALAWLAGNVATAGAPPQRLMLWGSALVLLQVAAEEVYFRGWLQPVLTEAWGQVAGILVSALAFAGLHLAGGAQDLLSLLNLFLGGLLFALLFRRGGGLAAPVAAHWGWNWGEEMLLGLSPNPGVGGFGAVANLELAGSPPWGGGNEGLNASLAMTVALLALVAPLALLSRRRHPGA